MLIERILSVSLVVGAIVSVACATEKSSSNAVKTADSTAVADSTAHTSIIAQAPATSAATLPVVSLVGWRFMPGGDSVAKVEVRTTSTVDTVAGLFAVLEPVVTKDAVVHGIAADSDGFAKNGFDYSSLTKKLSLFPLPRDLNGAFEEIEFNEDARFLAYVAHTESGGIWAAVRSWPGMDIVVRSASSQGYPSDVGYDKVSWTDSTHFEIAYRIDSGATIIVDGDALTKTVKVDTLAADQSKTP